VSCITDFSHDLQTCSTNTDRHVTCSTKYVRTSSAYKAFAMIPVHYYDAYY